MRRATPLLHNILCARSQHLLHKHTAAARAPAASGRQIVFIHASFRTPSSGPPAGQPTGEEILRGSRCAARSGVLGPPRVPPRVQAALRSGLGLCTLTGPGLEVRVVGELPDVLEADPELDKDAHD